MPKVTIQCPNCKASGLIDDVYIGRKIKCSKCQMEFDVAVQENSSYTPSEDVNEINQTKIELYCKKCGIGISADAVFCSKCGTKIASSDVIPDTNESNLNKIETGNESVMTKQFGCLPFMGVLFLIGGIIAVVYFAAFFDTSVSVPTTEIFGQTIGGGRVNNLGLMNDRSNGIMIGIGAAIIGLIMVVASNLKSKN